MSTKSCALNTRHPNSCTEPWRASQQLPIPEATPEERILGHSRDPREGSLEVAALDNSAVLIKWYGLASVGDNARNQDARNEFQCRIEQSGRLQR